MIGEDAANLLHLGRRECVLLPELKALIPGPPFDGVSCHSFSLRFGHAGCAVNGRSVTQLADFLRFSKALALKFVLEQCGHWPSEFVSQCHSACCGGITRSIERLWRVYVEQANVYGFFTFWAASLRNILAA